MKFQYKALVAALALSAAAVPAQAAMTNAASGSSSLILTLMDFSSNLSAVFDLGYNYAGFNSLVVDAHTNGTLSGNGLSKSFSFDVTSGAYSNAWNSFMAAANPANVKWAVYAADGTGTGVGARGIITTYKSGSNQIITQQLTTTVANFDGVLTANNGIANHNSVADGASFVNTNASQAFMGRAVGYGGTFRMNATGAVAMGNFGDSLTVQQILSGAATSSPVTVSTLGLNGNFTFKMNQAGNLEFMVPVPEADSYALLLVGMGVAAFAARRRQA